VTSRSEPERPAVAQAESGSELGSIGARLRATRLRQRMTLKEVASSAGISESFLSQVERGVAGVSVPTLHRVATALGIMVADLFEPADVNRPQVVRRERRRSEDFAGARNTLLTPRPLQNLEVFWIELGPEGATTDVPFAHGDSDEVLVVVRGEVEVTVDGQAYALGPGDSIAYGSAAPHKCRNAGHAVAEVIIALSPPSI
jgi:transcriptional regulator with XRE-family HTH domain